MSPPKIQEQCGWDPSSIYANELVDGPMVRINVSGDLRSPISKKALAEQALAAVGSHDGRTALSFRIRYAISNNSAIADISCTSSKKTICCASRTSVSEDLKRQAALAALDEIRDGMIVGLGTGSTASIFIRELGKARLKVLGIPTSEQSAGSPGKSGVLLTTFEQHPHIDRHGRRRR